MLILTFEIWLIYLNVHVLKIYAQIINYFFFYRAIAGIIVGALSGLSFLVSILAFICK